MQLLWAGILLSVALAGCSDQPDEPAKAAAPSVKAASREDPSNCKATTAGWANMQLGTTALEVAGQWQSVTTRIADDAAERAAGYQWICPSSAQDSAVLFIFPQPLLASFHMRNVFVPLEIGFFDADGRLVGVRHMTPEPPSSGPGRGLGGRYYRPDAAFKYALEMPRTAQSSALFSQPQLRLRLP